MKNSLKTPETVADEDLDKVHGGLILNLSVGVVAQDDQTAATADATRNDPYRNFNFRIR